MVKDLLFILLICLLIGGGPCLMVATRLYSLHAVFVLIGGLSIMAGFVVMGYLNIKDNGWEI